MRGSEVLDFTGPRRNWRELGSLPHISKLLMSLIFGIWMGKNIGRYTFWGCILNWYNIHNILEQAFCSSLSCILFMRWNGLERGPGCRYSIDIPLHILTKAEIGVHR